MHLRTAANVTLFALLSISYWLAAAGIAAARPFWMDEVLAVWTARLPSVGVIWDALKQGSDFSPPLYHVILQKVIQLGGDNTLALRLPSIAAIYVAGIAAFVIMRRRHQTPIAMLVMALCLTSCLFLFAVQARPYALVAACFALTLVIWDSPIDKPPSWNRAAAIFALLAVAVGMHFYAVLLAAAVGIMELLWTFLHRRIRWLYIVAISLACLSVFLWLPIMQHVMAFNGGDTGAPEYYARPRLSLLPAVYALLMVGHDSVILSPLTVLTAAAVTSVVIKRRAGAARASSRPKPENIDIVVWVACAIPLLIFLFSYLVTHTFNLRYVIVAVFGLSILTAQLVAGMRWAIAWSYLVVVAAVGLSLSTFTKATAQTATGRALKLIERAPPGLSIATGDGLRYFELRESADAAAAERLVYLKSPAGTVSPDPTNEHEVIRWASLNPRLVVADIEPFVSAHPRFLLFSDSGGTDLLPGQLAERGYPINIIAQDGNAYLAEVKSRAFDR